MPANITKVDQFSVGPDTVIQVTKLTMQGATASITFPDIHNNADSSESIIPVQDNGDTAPSTATFAWDTSDNQLDISASAIGEKFTIISFHPGGANRIQTNDNSPDV